MKIPLKNQTLNFGFFLFKEPNLKKLRKELSDFFNKNEIERVKIKKFRIEETPSGISYRIVPTEPSLEECLSAEGSYEEKIKGIGKKYGIRNLGFVYWCYHK